MLLATWNVNSLLARLERVTAGLERRRPDVVCLQETKCPDEAFPRQALLDVGYHACTSGQRGRNGVAILSRTPPECVVTALPAAAEDEDGQSRFVSARAGDLDVISVYVPNGQGIGTEAYFYKLEWTARLLGHLRASFDPARPLVLAGDFNICPADIDVHAPEYYRNRLHCTEHERRALRYLEQWGFVDALRHVRPDAAGLYSWFDYGAHSLRKNEGLRIDLIYVTRPLVDRIEAVEIDLDERSPTRSKTKPSDHAPVLMRLASAS
ncbi:MAG: exodeoxyribonuclease III [Planctomycetota bacterium]|nr:exodeoxyribonuclease III [Planctomycetota bacterium]